MLESIERDYNEYLQKGDTEWMKLGKYIREGFENDGEDYTYSGKLLQKLDAFSVWSMRLVGDEVFAQFIYS